jgi:hypothetical protein
VYLLAILFLGSWLGQFFTQLSERLEAKVDKISRQLDGRDDSSGRR